MDTLFSLDTKVRDIVIRVPRSDELFKQYKIDFCCGGNRPLQEAIEEKGLNEQEIISSLQALYENAANMKASDDEQDWTNAPYSQIIDHVIRRHHAYLMEELPELSLNVTKIFRVHGEGHSELAELHRIYHELKTELEHHLIKEEQEIFPLIIQYEASQTDADLQAALDRIEELESEHEEAGNLLKRIREITSDFTLPHDACTTYRITFKRLEELEADMFQHIHLENNIMFPRLAKEA